VTETLRSLGCGHPQVKPSGEVGLGNGEAEGRAKVLQLLHKLFGRGCGLEGDQTPVFGPDLANVELRRYWKDSREAW